MIRNDEKSIAYKAAALSFLVHAVLLLMLLLSFNWKVVQPASVATVELWDALPQVTAPKPAPKVVPKPKVEEPRPLPKPEPKPQPQPEPKADIQLKKEQPKPEVKPEIKKEQPRIEPKPKPEPEPRKEPPKVDEPQPDPELERKIRELQQAMLEEDLAQAPARASVNSPAPSSAVDQSEIAKYIGMINSKIRRNVNERLCGSGNPELMFSIRLAPTGDIVGHPELLEGSGIPACDESVERAILQAQPLPVPAEAELFVRFRDLKLRFRPQGTN